jgi:hypothetical protein
MIIPVRKLLPTAESLQNVSGNGGFKSGQRQVIIEHFSLVFGLGALGVFTKRNQTPLQAKLDVFFALTGRGLAFFSPAAAGANPEIGRV